MKLFRIGFEPIRPVGGCCLVVLAKSVEEAADIASETIMHTSKFTVEEIPMDKSRVVVYRNGYY